MCKACENKDNDPKASQFENASNDMYNLLQELEKETERKIVALEEEFVYKYPLLDKWDHSGVRVAAAIANKNVPLVEGLQQLIQLAKMRKEEAARKN
jgi:hypothetical protein